MTANALPVFDAQHSGVYPVPRSTSELRRVVNRAGGVWLDVDLSEARDKKSVLAAIAAACAFPRTFGFNWDALTDSLQDLSWRPAAGYVLELRGVQSFTRAQPSDWNTLLEILGLSAAHWRAQGKPFIVLVDSADKET